MKRILLAVFLLHIPLLVAFGQEPETPRAEEKPIIESIDVSGVPDNKITGELREAMQSLVGERFDQLAADELGFRIQKETSQRISAIRQLPGTTPDHVKLSFEFSNEAPETEAESKHGGHFGMDTNVNSRYTVESVDLRGIPSSLISDQLREDMNKLVGEKMDEDRARDIERSIRRQLRNGYTVSKRVERGSDKDHVRLIFEAEKKPLFDFHKFGNYLVGQSKQGVSYGVDLGFGHHTNRVAVGVLDDGDALLERDEGYRLGFENIKAGTEHLGFRIEYFHYDLKWKPATQIAVAASPQIPGIYRERRGIEPSLTVAVNRQFRITAGVNVTSLQMQYPDLHFQNANFLTASANYQNQWGDRGSNDQQLSGTYTIHTAAHTLDSDFIYTRHFGEVQYDVREHRNEFIATGMAGLLTGPAPLFERFSLGNTTTLRGWNKYDLNPAGGDRMAYGSLEYRYSVLQVYYDFGSVWNSPQSPQVSHAVGVGLHGRDGDGGWFMTFGVPIRSGHIQPLNPLFIAGVRF